MTGKKIKVGLIALGVLLLAIVLIRVFTPEDTWICENGEWVQHGNPVDVAPSTECF